METRDHVVPSVSRRPGVVAVFLAAGGWLAADSAHAWSSAALAGAAAPAPATVAPLDWARRTCDGIARRSPVLTDRWHYDVGLVLSGFESVWRKTGDRRYLEYIKSNVDPLVGPGGVIKGYEPGAYILDDVNMGKVLFALHADDEGHRRQGALSQGARTRCARS